MAYADEVKTAALGVAPSIIAAHGAVSAETAIAMADGVRSRLGTDLAVSVTGIAGPGGGTPGKPVGLTYIAVAGGPTTTSRRYLWPGDREANRRESVRVALEDLIAAAERSGS